MSGFKVDLSRIFDVRPRTVVITLVGGAAAVVAYIYIKKKLESLPPKKWRKVGEISDLLCYPIKSCGWIRMEEFDCTQLGLEKNFIRDRTFMLINTNGEFTTARTHPKLVKVVPEFDESTMKLSAPGMIDLIVDVARLFTLTPIKATVFDQTVDAIDAGEEAARWFSRYILQEDFGIRLVFYPMSFPTREVRKKNNTFDILTSDVGALHDATGYMMINEGSILELNTRVKTPVTALNFRPNMVVKGPTAFEEDTWKWVKIGDELIFRNVKPCTRCLFVNIDPDTAERNPDEEPLKTLKSYRKFAKTRESPVMGVHLGLRKGGKVRIGDPVYVESN